MLLRHAPRASRSFRNRLDRTRGAPAKAARAVSAGTNTRCRKGINSPTATPFLVTMNDFPLSSARMTRPLSLRSSRWVMRRLMTPHRSTRATRRRRGLPRQEGARLCRRLLHQKGKKRATLCQDSDQPRRLDAGGRRRPECSSSARGPRVSGPENGSDLRPQFRDAPMHDIQTSSKSTPKYRGSSDLACPPLPATPPWDAASGIPPKRAHSG